MPGLGLELRMRHPVANAECREARRLRSGAFNEGEVIVDGAGFTQELGIEAGAVNVEGDLDFRGTLAVSKEVPVGFRTIRLNFELDTDASDEELDTLVRLTQRYCVVYQTLAAPPDETMSWTRAAD